MSSLDLDQHVPSPSKSARNNQLIMCLIQISLVTYFAPNQALTEIVKARGLSNLICEFVDGTISARFLTVEDGEERAQCL